MIPSILSSQVRRGIEEFLRTTFPITTPFFAGSLDRLFHSEESIFRGPFVSMKLPFEWGDPARTFFPEVTPSWFRAYRHQQDAFERLGVERPLSTIVATGTGSGKTESFLHPILDHCWRHRGERGIKAILVYPMNALATDQGKRIARAIAQNPNLRGNVTSGLYVGGAGIDRSMGDTNVITDRNAIRDSPPDILLTNYKMLDYLLIRPEDLRLWRDNGPETLRFLVVDELHTFDGAQGADLACLIRRLKARLKTPSTFLCCVGTSATLGDETGGATALDLREFAQQLFGEPFDAQCVVHESLQSLEEFLSGALITRSQPPGPEHIDVLDGLRYGSVDEYVAKQLALWFDALPSGNEDEWRLDLAEQLRQHAFFRNVLAVLGGQAKEMSNVLGQLQRVLPRSDRGDYPEKLLDSFLTLVSAARIEVDGVLRPFLQVRVQLWLRELTRLVGLVAPRERDQPPIITFVDDLRPEERKKSLPIIHCRECGLTGWGAVRHPQDPSYETDVRTFYQKYFSSSPDVAFLYPEVDEASEQSEFASFLCPVCFRVEQAASAIECPSCRARADQQVRVWIPDSTRTTSQGKLGIHDCAACGGRNTLSILGSRAASLTSVAISQIFTSPFNDDKKMLAFSDSVQDASHRAGFFGARTYSFTFRGALQKVIDAQGALIDLLALPDAFIAYWREKLAGDDGQFIAMFVPPDMEWQAEYEYLREHGQPPDDSTLLRDVERRIAWEIWSELTFKSRIGRTLERSSAAGVGLNHDMLRRAIEEILPKLKNEIGYLRELGERELTDFLVGILASLKNRGGVEQASLADYILGRGNSFLLHRVPYLPAFGRSTRAPAFLSDRSMGHFQTLRRQNPNAPTWFEEWLSKAFHRPALAQYQDEIFGIVLQKLCDVGILFSTDVAGATVWGIRQQFLSVTNRVVQFRCGRCSFNVSPAEQDSDLWQGTPCLRYRCHGSFSREAEKEDYYRRLYTDGDPARVFATEHTGQLEREKREAVEIGFIHGAKPGDPNLLSCTPTLEMGIDIGDLSSLALCSVPPKTSNYLQRIGRAGRVDGNAFIFTVAAGRPHDLFFFFEPEEMIRGVVETPGLFLNASAVLERQFTGYVFDRWIETKSASIPHRMGAVLDGIEQEKKGPGVFPLNLITYFEANRTPLEEGFFGMFPGVLQDYARRRLVSFIEGGDEQIKTFTWRLANGLAEVVSERKSLRNSIRRLTERITKLDKEGPLGNEKKEMLNELRQEKNALQEVVRGINDREVLNFFTDEGLLPNYAFPESGVELKSVIYRRVRDAGGQQRYETKTYTYERPASMAITELAPASSFYVEGRRLVIDQVNIDLSKPSRWRICAQCSYMELQGESELQSTCPSCGDGLWSDAGQVVELLRMRQVISTMDERKSRSFDESDDRAVQFFQKNLFVIGADDDITAAYAIDSDEIPFGFEFFRRMTLREVNFGERGKGSPPIQVAGHSLEQSGFVVCDGCGKVRGIQDADPDPQKAQRKRHSFSCRYRDTENEEKAHRVYFLYREFSSEGIRILLPVVAGDAGDLGQLEVGSLVAALELGLRKKFKGDPGHLQTTVYDEPDRTSSLRRRYLVLYDGVPGGTGYLNELMRDPDQLMDVFALAHDVLARCSCQNDPKKDGCYRCILAYRGRHDPLNTSRRAALNILAPLLRHRDKIKPIDRLRSISLNSLIESELERNFIEALRRMGARDGTLRITDHVVHGKAGYYLACPGGNYLIEPQVSLGPSEGVSVPSRVDFMIYPESGGIPIAVFTDGFEFHADPATLAMRLDADISQRMALIRSGRYYVWSLSWEDVNEQLGPVAPPFVPFGSARLSVARGILSRLLGDAGEAAGRLFDVGSLDAFVRVLRERPAIDLPKTALAYASSLIDSKQMIDPIHARDLRSQALNLQRGVPWPPSIGGDASGWLVGYVADQDLVDGFVFVNPPTLLSGDRTAAAVTMRINDERARVNPGEWRASWRRALWTLNLLQFLPRSEMVTTSGLLNGRHSWITSEDLFDRQEEKRTASDDRFEAIFRSADPSVQPILRDIADGGLALPIDGYELEDAGGRIVGMAELAWEELRLSVLVGDQTESRPAFEAAGWSCFSVDDRGDLIRRIKEMTS